MADPCACVDCGSVNLRFDEDGQGDDLVVCLDCHQTIGLDEWRADSAALFASVRKQLGRNWDEDTSARLHVAERRFQALLAVRDAAKRAVQCPDHAVHCCADWCTSCRDAERNDRALTAAIEAAEDIGV